MKHCFTLIIAIVFALAAQAQPAGDTFLHPWQGKRIAYFGDSITDPRVRAGNDKWWTLLTQWLQATPYCCYAISGRQWNDIPRQTKALATDHQQDVDAIIILMGTNDYNNAVPLGQWYRIDTLEVAYTRDRKPLTQRRAHRTPDMDGGTFRGRINIALAGLKRTYPTKQIVLLTATHRGYFSSSATNVQPDEYYPNAIGLWLDDYNQVLREAATVWAVPVIDLAAACGMLPVIDEQAQYFSNPQHDRLHPSDAGYRRIASTLYYQLATLPCTF